MMRGALWLGLSLVACSGDEGDDGMPMETGEDPAACPNELESSLPEDGATTVNYRSNLRFSLAEPDDTAVITLADAEGNDVPGTSRVESDVVIFDPTDPLTPETSYTATLSYECDKDETVSFTTSSTGLPLTIDPIGRVYNLDLTTGLWTVPPGIGNLITSLITTDISLLFMAESIVEDGDGGPIISFIGSSKDPLDPDQQDDCVDPFLVEGGMWTDPFFVGATDQLTIEVLGIEATIVNLEIEGDYTPDGSAIEIARFAGEIDDRQIAALDLCDAISVLASCGPCSLEPASETCIQLQVENLRLPFLADSNPLVAEPVCEE
ncbi:MAG: Ig-like domain-containing protein [Myxococcota bacterium]